MSNEIFEPYGTPPRFDLEEHKDLFEVWHLQWKIYVKLSTITTALPLADQPKYLARSPICSVKTHSSIHLQFGPDPSTCPESY